MMLDRVRAPSPELWPPGSQSQTVFDGELEWRVVRHGSVDGPVLVMIHGTGASVHSFGYLAAELADCAQLVAFDLPGHGGTILRRHSELSLRGMARSVQRLLGKLEVSPDYVVAHSAGTAIALQMKLFAAISPRRIFGINSALRPISGNAILAPIARLLFAAPFATSVFAWQARHGGVENLLRQTVSVLPADDVAAYKRLFVDTGHIKAAIGMMANWDLSFLQSHLGQIDCPTTLIAAADDPMVSNRVSIEAASALPDCEYVELAHGGHLVHESEPVRVATIITDRIEADVMA